MRTTLRAVGLPSWIVQGTPPWVVDCVQSFPPHVESRIGVSSPTPQGLGLLNAIAQMGKDGAVSMTVPPQAVRWAGWIWRPQEGWHHVG